MMCCYISEIYPIKLTYLDKLREGAAGDDRVAVVDRSDLVRDLREPVLEVLALLHARQRLDAAKDLAQLHHELSGLRTNANNKRSHRNTM